MVNKGGRGNRLFSCDDIKQIFKMFIKEEIPMKHIAEQLNCSRTLIHNILYFKDYYDCSKDLSYTLDMVESKAFYLQYESTKIKGN